MWMRELQYQMTVSKLTINTRLALVADLKIQVEV